MLELYIHYGLKLLKVSGPKLWNSIPNKIRSSQSLNSFKFMFKKYLISDMSICSRIKFIIIAIIIIIIIYHYYYYLSLFIRYCYFYLY